MGSHWSPDFTKYHLELSARLFQQEMTPAERRRNNVTDIT
jgi:hypothetical protein